MARSYARAMVDRSRAEAVAAGSPTIEAEHVLLALADEPGTAAQLLLADVGLDHEVIRASLALEVEWSLGVAGVAPEVARAPRTSSHPGREPRIGSSFKLVLRRAVQSGDVHRLGPVEVLVGVLGAEVGTVPRALAVAGVDREELLAKAGRIRAAGGAGPR